MTGLRPAGRRIIEVAALTGPLLIARLVPSGLQPRLLVFAVAYGWWLAAAGIASTLIALAVPRPAPGKGLARVADALPGGRWAGPALLGAAFAVAALSLPAWREIGPAAGDEPKYLRIARSLYRDLDADVSSNQAGPLTGAGLARNVRRLAASTAEATVTLVRGLRPPLDHVWSLGNWTVSAWYGGHYHVQGPGLPALLAPVVGPGAPDEPGPTIPPRALTLMALVLAVAFVQTARLAAEASGSSLPLGALAAALIMASPAVFVGGYHLYPEAVAVAAVPWLARHARPGGPGLPPGRVAVLGLVAGGLVWLHVKFLLLGLAAAGLLALRLGRSRLLGLLAATAAVPLAAWLLFQYRLTGLLRPDALYVRFDSQVWRGGASTDLAWRFLGGLANGLFGARDGIGVMVPVAACAALGVPWLWRLDRRTTLALAALFSAVWVTAALHGSGAPGPPGRLLSAAAPLLAVPLAIAVRRLRGRLAFRWSLAAATLVSLAVVTSMAANPRLTINPYRGVADAADLRRDLPAGRFDPAGATLDLARAGLLLAVIGFWAWRSSRVDDGSGPSSPAAGAPRRALAVWQEAVAFQVGAWITLALSASALQALTRLAGG